MATVLIVEDDPAVRETYREWLSSVYDVRTAVDGEQALSLLDATVDVVLLDRRLPGIDGDTVARRIRDDYDCLVAMVTAVDPDADAVELPFDEYVVKPAGEADIAAVVQDLIERQRYDEHLQEYYALVSKLATLRTTRPEELRRAPEYDSLRDDIAALRADLDDATTTFSDQDYRAVLRQLLEAETDDGDPPE